MTSRVYSTNLIQGSVSFGSQLVYAVPEGYRAVLRDITASSPFVSNGAIVRALYVVDSVSGAYVTFWPEQYVQPWRPYHWEGRQAFDYPSGFTVSSVMPDEVPWTARCFGYLLKLS